VAHRNLGQVRIQLGLIRPVLPIFILAFTRLK
jgi:hypothetical protein